MVLPIYPPCAGAQQQNDNKLYFQWIFSLPVTVNYVFIMFITKYIIIFFIIAIPCFANIEQDENEDSISSEAVPSTPLHPEDVPGETVDLNKDEGQPELVEDAESTAAATAEIAVEVADNSSVATTTDPANSTVHVSCQPRLESDSQVVELVNATGLLSLLESDLNVTSRRSPAQCLAILFYASWCPFSCMAAPHFNALPRAFPDIKVAAMDSMKHYSLNTQFGIVGVPTILLFHNGRPTARFNETDYTLKMFSQFVTKYTGLEPRGLLNVTSADFAGPVLSVAERETDHWLILSWVFVSACGLYFLVQSALWRSLVESLKNVWREADEAHHEHAD